MKPTVVQGSSTSPRFAIYRQSLGEKLGGGYWPGDQSGIFIKSVLCAPCLIL